LDLYPQETESSKKLIALAGEGYDQFLVDSGGKFLSDRPWFITFINAAWGQCNEAQESLQHLAHYFQGDVQFAYVSTTLEERLAYTYEVYTEKPKFQPRSYYIDKDGMAHAFPHVFPAINTTVAWIEDKDYKNSPFRFKVLARMPEWKLYWGYAKKEVRFWYQAHLMDKVDGLLKKIKVSYLTDLDPMDFSTSRPYQKMDRQIIIIVGIVGMTLEAIWDWVFAETTPAQKKKRKSFVDASSSSLDVKPDKPRKSNRDKID